MSTQTNPFLMRRFQAELHKALIQPPAEPGSQLIPVTDIDSQTLESFLCLADPHCTEEYNQDLRECVLSPDPAWVAYAYAQRPIRKATDILGMVALHADIEEFNWETFRFKKRKAGPEMRDINMSIYIAALYHLSGIEADVVLKHLGGSLGTSLALNVQKVLRPWEGKIDIGVGLTTIFGYYETLPSPNLMGAPHPPAKLGVHVEAICNAFLAEFADFSRIGWHEMWATTCNHVPYDDEALDEDPIAELKAHLRDGNPD